MGSPSRRQAVQQKQFSNAFTRQENLHDSTLYTNIQLSFSFTLRITYSVMEHSISLRWGKQKSFSNQIIRRSPFYLKRFQTSSLQMCKYLTSCLRPFPATHLHTNTHTRTRGVRGHSPSSLTCTSAPTFCLDCCVFQRMLDCNSCLSDV